MSKLLSRFTRPQIALLALAALAVLFVAITAATVAGQAAASKTVPAAPATAGAAQPESTPGALVWSDEGTQAASSLSNGGSAQSGLWPVVATILVLGLIYACLWGYKTLSGRGQPAATAARQMQLQSSVRLTAQQSLHVVRFGPELLLVGASATGLTVLARQPATDATAEVDSGAAGTGFPQLFSRALEDARGKA